MLAASERVCRFLLVRQNDLDSLLSEPVQFRGFRPAVGDDMGDAGDGTAEKIVLQSDLRAFHHHDLGSGASAKHRLIDGGLLDDAAGDTPIHTDTAGADDAFGSGDLVECVESEFSHQGSFFAVNLSAGQDQLHHGVPLHQQ